jgi:hypothetical protein
MVLLYKMSIFNLFPEQWQQMDTYLSKDHWFDNEGNAVYTTNYIDLYGEPDTGFPYYVVEGDPVYDYRKPFNEEEMFFQSGCYGYDERMPYGLNKIQKEVNKDFKPMDKKQRATHFYCRLEHFKQILSQLMGYTQKIPQYILDQMPNQWEFNGDIYTMWEVIRNKLKKTVTGYYKGKRSGPKYGQIYYNRIPTILRLKGICNFPPVKDKIWQNVINNFYKMHIAWQFFETDRKYFPNLRFVACRLLFEENVDVTWIPWARTPKKYDSLEQTFGDIWDLIDNIDGKEVKHVQCKHCQDHAEFTIHQYNRTCL